MARITSPWPCCFRGSRSRPRGHGADRRALAALLPWQSQPTAGPRRGSRHGRAGAVARAPRAKATRGRAPPSPLRGFTYGGTSPLRGTPRLLASARLGPVLNASARALRLRRPRALHGTPETTTTATATTTARRQQTPPMRGQPLILPAGGSIGASLPRHSAPGPLLRVTPALRPRRTRAWPVQRVRQSAQRRTKCSTPHAGAAVCASGFRRIKQERGSHRKAQACFPTTSAAARPQAG